MGVRANLLDIIKRVTKFDKKVGIITNGEDNQYPERIERFINNSVTSKMSANLMASFLVGKGFGEDINKIMVSPKTSLLKFSQKLSKSLTRQRGAFIQINYNMNYEFDSFDLIPFTHCRVGKKDDNNYNGKIGVSAVWSNKMKAEQVQIVDVYNPDEKVIKAQVDKCEGKTDIEKWENYKGQILFINLDDDYIYPLSTIDAVMYDCDSESQASIFKNKSLRKGFFGKTVVITKPLLGEESEYESNQDYRNAVDEREEFKNTIDSFIGAENAGGALHVELEHDGDTFDNAIKFENISSDIDDKMFEYTENSTSNNILMAFNNLPRGLVKAENALFGNSGEALREMRRQYQENTITERMELEQVVQLLMRKFKNPLENIKIIPLVDEVKEEPKQEIKEDEPNK